MAELPKPVVNGFERHIQTVIQVVITALLLWIGSAVLNVRDSSIRLEEKYTQTRSDVVEIKAELAALRTQLAVASATGQTTTTQIREFEQRLTKVETMMRGGR
jgi:ribosomal protein L29